MDHEIFWLSAAFICFFFLFGKKSYNLIIQTIDKKIIEITHSIDEAQKTRDESENLLELTKEKLEKADMDMAKTISNAQEKVEVIYLERSKQLKEELEQKTNEAINKFEEQKKLAFALMNEELVKLSNDILTKYFEEEGKKHSIEESIEVLKKMKINN